MPHQRQAERVLCFIAGEPGSSVDDSIQLRPGRQFTFLRRNAAGDLGELRPRRKIVFHDNEQLIELNRNLHYR